MPVVQATDAPTFESPGSVITGLASPRRGAKDTAAWRVLLRPDIPSPAHALDREEVFVVLAGSVTARFADREETAAAGGALIVPAHEWFTLLAQGEAAEAICILPVGAQVTTNEGSFTPPWAE